MGFLVTARSVALAVLLMGFYSVPGFANPVADLFNKQNQKLKRAAGATTVNGCLCNFQPVASTKYQGRVQWNSGTGKCLYSAPDDALPRCYVDPATCASRPYLDKDGKPWDYCLLLADQPTANCVDPYTVTLKDKSVVRASGACVTDVGASRPLCKWYRGTDTCRSDITCTVTALNSKKKALQTTWLPAWDTTATQAYASRNFSRTAWNRAASSFTVSCKCQADTALCTSSLQSASLILRGSRDNVATLTGKTGLVNCTTARPCTFRVPRKPQALQASSTALDLVVDKALLTEPTVTCGVTVCASNKKCTSPFASVWSEQLAVFNTTIDLEAVVKGLGTSSRLASVQVKCKCLNTVADYSPCTPSGFEYSGCQTAIAATSFTFFKQTASQAIVGVKGLQARSFNFTACTGDVCDFAAPATAIAFAPKSMMYNISGPVNLACPKLNV